MGSAAVLHHPFKTIFALLAAVTGSTAALIKSMKPENYREGLFMTARDRRSLQF
jgi:hypothetical protein